MKTEHTKGPWEIHSDLGEPMPQFIYGADDTYVCKIKRDIGKQPSDANIIKRFNANARLIAAAPEYDDGSRLVVEWYDLIKQNYPEMAGLLKGMEILKTAITKAEGKG